MRAPPRQRKNSFNLTLAYLSQPYALEEMVSYTCQKMEFAPEKLPKLAKARFPWLSILALFLSLFLFYLGALYIQVQENKKEKALGGLSFSHGLELGADFSGPHAVEERIKDAGFSYLREIEPGNYEFTDNFQTILLRVKGKEDLGMTAIYMYVPEEKYEAFLRTHGSLDYLGANEESIRREFGRPNAIERRIRQVFKRGEPRNPSWAYETWYYEGRNVSFAVSFNREGKVVETALQIPIR